MNNQTPFAWYTIETEGKYLCLYLNNRNGLKRLVRKDTEPSYIWKVLERRKALNERISKVLQEAIQKLMTDPEARARLQASAKRYTTQAMDKE